MCSCLPVYFPHLIPNSVPSEMLLSFVTAIMASADRLLTSTRQLGKTRALAKGARKIASRKADHIEPFTHVKMQLAKGRDMLILTQADTVDAYQPARRFDPDGPGLVCAFELLDRFTYQDETENRPSSACSQKPLRAWPHRPIRGW